MSTASNDSSQQVRAHEAPQPIVSGSWLERHAVPFLILLCACAFLPWISTAPVRSASEADALVIAREVFAGVTDGAVMKPPRNGLADLSAPPLAAWILGALGQWTGSVTPLLARYLSAASVTGLAVFLLMFLRRRFTISAALIGAGVAVACAVLLGVGSSGATDALALLGTGVALPFGWSALRDGTTKRRLAFAALLLALAIMVRGLEPIVAWTIGASASIFSARSPRGRRIVKALLITGAALAPFLLWIASVLVLQNKVPPSLADIAGGLAGVGAVSPFCICEPPAAVGLEFLLYLAPLAPLLLLLIPIATPRSAAGTDSERHSLWWFLVGSGLASALLYAATPVAQPRLPIAALTSCAVLLAWGFERANAPDSTWFPRAVVNGLARVLTWLAPFALLLFGWFAKWRPYDLVLGAAAILLALRVAAAFGRRRGATPLLAVTLLLAALTVRAVYGLVLAPKLAHDFPAQGVSAAIERLVPRGDRVIFVGSYSSPLHFAIDRPLEVMRDEEELGRALAARPHSKLNPVFIFDAEDRLHEGPPRNLAMNGFWMRPRGSWRLLRAE